jgi:uncharacterized protein YbjT (DUF2867 family)
MENQILVLGGTGKTGKRVAERLINLNIPTRIGSRKASPAFDWENPENWTEVLEGVQKVYITFQPDLASPGSVEKIRLFVDTAKKAQVQKLVLLSGRGEKEAQLCEDLVIQSGIDYTIVRASWFMQNFSEGSFYDSIAAGDIVLPEVNTTEPFIDIDDLADVVVAALTTPDHSKTIYELTGPELLSFEQAIAIISTATNRPINFSEVTLQEYVQMLKSYDTPEDIVWLIQYLFSEILDGRNESVTHDVEKVLGRKPTTFNNYVSKTIESGIWQVAQVAQD